MRLIDADALKERIMKSLGIKSLDNLLPAEKAIVQHIDRMPTIRTEQRWIPCSERLPERSGNYLVTRDIIRGYEPEACAIDYFEADQLNWDGYGNLVIAWMQLPEPYQKGDAE